MLERIYQSWSPSPGSSDERLGLIIRSAGRFHACDHVVGDRIRDDHLLIHCRQGCGHYVLAGRAFDIRPGTILWAPPGLVHAYGADQDQGWEIHWVHFAGSQAEALVAYAGFTRKAPLRPFPGQGPASTGLADLCALLAGRRWSSGDEAALRLHRFLVDFGLDERGRRHGDPRIAPALAAEYGDIAAMAAACGLSSWQFIRRFRAATGITPWRYAIGRRIARAKELLADRNRPVKAIARELGFTDPNYFSRLFRRETGCTAREYRRRLG